ncbi:hypothetical protein L596_028646 [Steinernema carpocapsae]|uniref:Uncharacterized protein n=1 Tax=Steinernema carpocapsae TaxID=34508 RepID=A0A4U5LZ13_STECR|nr:hypothetical protein L596_028646 [Steinernema carpocapsae]
MSILCEKHPTQANQGRLTNQGEKNVTMASSDKEQAVWPESPAADSLEIQIAHIFLDTLVMRRALINTVSEKSWFLLFLLVPNVLVPRVPRDRRRSFLSVVRHPESEACNLRGAIYDEAYELTDLTDELN